MNDMKKTRYYWILMEILLQKWNRSLFLKSGK